MWTLPEAPEPIKSPISNNFGSIALVNGSPVLIFFMPLLSTMNPSFLNTT